MAPMTEHVIEADIEDFGHGDPLMCNKPVYDDKHQQKIQNFYRLLHDYNFREIGGVDMQIT